jgi:hypothetical protein
VIRSTFQLAPGIGPYRERQLWAMGMRRWDDLPPAPAEVLSEKLDLRIRGAVARARDALLAGDAAALARMVPDRERWRFLPTYGDRAGYLDVEAAGDELTVIGILDAAGPAIFLAGRDLEAFPARAADWPMLVTFNGGSFDLPILRRAFPAWKPPPIHVDLRHLWARLGMRCGLKELEEKVGLARPDALRGVDGNEAISLWRRHLAGDRAALGLLATYNLYDAVGLRTLFALGYNRLLEKLRMPGEPVPVSWRGDVLYDVTRIALALQ